MKSQKHLLEQIPGVQGIFLLIVVLVGVLNHLVEVGQDGVVHRPEAGEIGAVVDAPFFVHPLQHQLNGVDVPVCEVLVGAEKILQERDVLAEPGLLPERLRRLGIVLAVHIPHLGFQRIDAVLPSHEVHETAAQISAELSHLVLRVQADH